MKNDIINTMKPMSEIISSLQKEGHSKDFDVNKQGDLIVLNSDKVYKPKEIEILKVYRFEGMSNPADSAILYLLKTNDNLTGTIIDSYGAENSARTSDFLKQLD